MTYYNNDNPLLDEGKIFDYFIWAYTLDNADTTETANPENKKVYLGWRNYNKATHNKWYKLLSLRFDYF